MRHSRNVLPNGKKSKNKRTNLVTGGTSPRTLSFSPSQKYLCAVVALATESISFRIVFVSVCVYVHDRILDYTACIGASRFAAVSFPRFLCNAHSPLGRTSMHCYVRMHGIIVCILPFSAVNTNYFCVYFIYIIYCRHAHKRFTAHFPFVVGKQYAFAQE